MTAAKELADILFCSCTVVVTYITTSSVSFLVMPFYILNFVCLHSC